jgi:hypothetical protein
VPWSRRKHFRPQASLFGVSAVSGTFDRAFRALPAAETRSLPNLPPQRIKVYYEPQKLSRRGKSNAAIPVSKPKSLRKHNLQNGSFGMFSDKLLYYKNLFCHGV